MGDSSKKTFYWILLVNMTFLISTGEGITIVEEMLQHMKDIMSDKTDILLSSLKALKDDVKELKEQNSLLRVKVEQIVAADEKRAAELTALSRRILEIDENRSEDNKALKDSMKRLREETEAVSRQVTQSATSVVDSQKTIKKDVRGLREMLLHIATNVTNGTISLKKEISVVKEETRAVSQQTKQNSAVLSESKQVMTKLNETLSSKIQQIAASLTESSGGLKEDTKVTLQTVQLISGNVINDNKAIRNDQQAINNRLQLIANNLTEIQKAVEDCFSEVDSILGSISILTSRQASDSERLAEVDGRISAVAQHFGTWRTCEDGWFEFSQFGISHCYRYVKERMSWYRGEEYCKKDGAHLVSIHSAEEQSFVQNLVRKHRESFWIGFNDIRREGNFEWSDGSRVDFTDWYQRKMGEINYGEWWQTQPSGGDTHDCTAQDWAYDKEWNDLPCDYTRYVVCKKQLCKN